MTATATRPRKAPTKNGTVKPDLHQPAPVIALAPIPIDSIAPSRLNPRKRFDKTELEDLAASIRAVGVLQPIVVREIPTEAETNPDRTTARVGVASVGKSWELIAGERRWRAAKLASLTQRHAASHDTAPAPIPRLRDLSYSSYARLNAGSLPRACLRRECACIGRALGYDDEVLDICTDPNRFRSLQAQQTKARNAENKRRSIQAISQLEDHVRAHSAVVSTRDLVLLCQALLGGAGVYDIEARRLTEAWGESSRTWLHDKAPSAERFRGVDKTSLNKLAAELESPALLRALVETICRKDLELRFDPEGGAGFGALAEWYVGQLPKRAGDDWHPPEEQPKKARAKA